MVNKTVGPLDGYFELEYDRHDNSKFEDTELISFHSPGKEANYDESGVLYEVIEVVDLLDFGGREINGKTVNQYVDELNELYEDNSESFRDMLGFDLIPVAAEIHGKTTQSYNGEKWFEVEPVPRDELEAVVGRIGAAEEELEISEFRLNSSVHPETPQRISSWDFN